MAKEQHDLHMKSSEVSVKTGSTPASLTIQGQVTKDNCKMVYLVAKRRARRMFKAVLQSVCEIGLIVSYVLAPKHTIEHEDPNKVKRLSLPFCYYLAGLTKNSQYLDQHIPKAETWMKNAAFSIDGSR